MKKLLKWVVIGVVVLLVFTYGMYAWDYKGNYNVSVSVPVHCSDSGEHTIVASTITSSSSPTSVWQFWSDLTSADGVGTGLYSVYCELNMTLLIDRNVLHQSFNIVADQDITFTFEFKNVEPGQGNIHVYIIDQASTKLYDHNYGVTVG